MLINYMENINLNPASVFHYFAEVCKVPRPSKKEEKIIAYLLAFAKQHQLEVKTDKAGNVLIKKPATPGKENLKTVILQSHIDMVCEKNSDVEHDFEYTYNGATQCIGEGYTIDKKPHKEIWNDSNGFGFEYFN